MIRAEMQTYHMTVWSPPIGQCTFGTTFYIANRQFLTRLPLSRPMPFRSPSICDETADMHPIEHFLPRAEKQLSLRQILLFYSAMRRPNFFHFSLSRAVSIAFSTSRSGLSPCNDFFGWTQFRSTFRTKGSLSHGSYLRLADSFAAFCAPRLRCLPPEQLEELWPVCLHTSKSGKISTPECQGDSFSGGVQRPT